jgi:sulfite exporter TauE/SafE
MDLALIAGAGLLGLAGAPHCTAMCAAPCAAATQRGGGTPGATGAGFQIGRLASYAAGGAAVAAGVNAFTAFSGVAPVLRPVWALLHVAVLALGLWLLATGRQPAWWSRLGSAPASWPVAARPGPLVASSAPSSVRPTGGARTCSSQAQASPRTAAWHAVRGPLRATASGSLWLAMPCGLLQSALVVAALANSPVGGAAAMASFAAASSIGLWLPGLAWRRMAAGRGAAVSAWAVRAAGGVLAIASVWALGHDLWWRIAVWCQSA